MSHEVLYGKIGQNGRWLAAVEARWTETFFIGNVDDCLP